MTVRVQLKEEVGFESALEVLGSFFAEIWNTMVEHGILHDTGTQSTQELRWEKQENAERVFQEEWAQGSSLDAGRLALGLHLSLQKMSPCETTV
jgi:hypothetical protein